MTTIAIRATEIYKELRIVLDEAKSAGMSDYESYKSLVEALNELAVALHTMLYIDKKLDPEEEKTVRETLSTIKI